MLLVAQSGDKGASRPVLLTRGIPKRSSFGFTKQFLEGAFSDVRKGTRAYLIALGSRPHTPVAPLLAQAHGHARTASRR